jgi:hypothetical protein
MKKLALLSLIVAIALVSCKKDETVKEISGPSYQVITGSVTDITNKVAIVNGSLANLNGINITEHGHVWSTSPAPTTTLTTKTAFGAVSLDAEFESNLSGLLQGTTYYVRAYAVDSTGTFYGTQTTFITESSFFEFVVSSNFLPSSSSISYRVWILIYDLSKELVEIQELENGQTFTFDWPTKSKSDKYNLQILSYYDFQDPSNSDYYYLNCYLNQEPEVWYLGHESDEPLTQIGSNTVTLTGVDLFNCEYYAAKNLYVNGSYNATTSTLEFAQYFNPDNIWITYTFMQQPPYFKMLDDVGIDDCFTLTGTDFSQMSSYVDITLPDNDEYDIYVESEDDLSTDYWEWFEILYKYGQGETNLKVYYPSGVFSGYYTDIWLKNNNVTEDMTLFRGAIPAQFHSLANEISVTNDSIASFHIDVTGVADLCSSRWLCNDQTKGEESLYYYILGSANDISSYSAPDFPDEIKIMNENLFDLQKLEYYNTYFMETNYYSGFSDYITQTYTQPGSLNIVPEYYYYKSIYKEGKKPTEKTPEHKISRRMKDQSFDF